MKKFTKELVDSYAEKLLIGLTEEENWIVLSEFDIIDANMELINQIPRIEDIPPMTHALDNFLVVPRQDIKENSVEIEKLLANCDKHNDREIEIPRVVG